MNRTSASRRFTTNVAIARSSAPWRSRYDIAWTLPDIQVVDVNLAGDRRLILHHRALNRVLLEERDARFVLQHLADLWGYDVLLKEVDPGTDSVLKEHAATPRGGNRIARRLTGRHEKAGCATRSPRYQSQIT